MNLPASRKIGCVRNSFCHESPKTSSQARLTAYLLEKKELVISLGRDFFYGKQILVRCFLIAYFNGQ